MKKVNDQFQCIRFRIFSVCGSIYLYVIIIARFNISRKNVKEKTSKMFRKIYKH